MTDFLHQPGAPLASILMVALGGPGMSAGRSKPVGDEPRRRRLRSLLHSGRGHRSR